MRISFTVPGDPHGKERPRVAFRGGKAHAFTPKTTHEYEKRVRLFAGRALAGLDFTPVDCPVRAQITARYDWPKKYLDYDPEGSHLKQPKPGTKLADEIKAMRYGHILPKKPDADNIAKSILDALNGLMYADDAQVFSLQVVKRWRDPETERFAGVDVVLEWEEQ